MSISHHSAVSVSGLTLVRPDGTTTFSGLDLSAGPGRHGLVGSNGSGKSTLLQLLAGQLQPTSGSISIAGTVALLPQKLTVSTNQRLSDVLGVAHILRAIDAIEAGSVDVADFDAVGDDWDVRERSQAVLGRVGLGHLELDRPVSALSGGELVLSRLSGLLLQRPEVLLLDEPSNNLDRSARARLAEVISTWPGTLIVASHDRELLGGVDDIAELRPPDALHWYGGNYDAYREALAVEAEAAQRAVDNAKADVRRQERDLAKSQIVLARRERFGRKAFENKREPKIVMGARKRAAQVSAAKLSATHTERLEQSRSDLEQAAERVRDDAAIRLDLDRTAVPERRQVLTASELMPYHGRFAEPIDLTLRGPEHIALSGDNGIGKSSLIRALLGLDEPRSGTSRVHVPWRLLNQRRDLLDPELSVVQNVRRHAPDAAEESIRAQLARLLFRGRAAEKSASVLSGGETLRATLACLLLAEPAPQLLVLDEPTNDLDVQSLTHLVEALGSFRGAMLVVSHDQSFLDDLGLDRVIELS